MGQVFWAIVALFGLMALVLIALGLRFQSLNKTSLGVSNIFEDGLLFAIFALLFAPIYLAWMGIQLIWFRVHRVPALPAAGDDPFLGRKQQQASGRDDMSVGAAARNEAKPRPD